MKKESQINPSEHSEIKVKLLKTYLDRYLSILNLAKGIEQINIFDLFSGEGLYENGAKGSPLIILENVIRLNMESMEKGKRAIPINCYFNDADVEQTNKLKKSIVTTKLGAYDFLEIQFESLDFDKVKHKVLEIMESKWEEKNFIFIDPYGYSDFTFGDIEAFLAKENSEVLLFLPTQFMYRFEEKATPKSLAALMNEIQESGEYESSESGLDFIEQLLTKFKAKLKGKFYCDAFIINRDKNQFFALFFFTSHIYGFEKFLEAKWQLDEEEGRGWHYLSNKLTLFSDQKKRPKIDKFEKQLLDYLKEIRTNLELYYFTLRNSHLPKHANEILKSLQNNGKLEVVNFDGSKARKGAFYISWSETKGEYAKVNLKLK